MLYFAKALVGFILPPGLLVVVMAVCAGAFLHRSKTAAMCFAICALLLYVMSIPLIGDTLMRSLEQSTTPPVRVQGDVLVMLGGGATPDTPDVDGQGMLSPTAANRLLTTARLYRQTGLPVLLSGGQVFPDDGVESHIAARQLESLGVPVDKVIVEDHSRNTKENAEWTAKELHARGLKQPVLITSAFHMCRAVVEFQKAGLDVQPYPCDYQVSKHVRWYINLFVPTGQAIAHTWTALHEYLGIVAAKL